MNQVVTDQVNSNSSNRKINRYKQMPVSMQIKIMIVTVWWYGKAVSYSAALSYFKLVLTNHYNYIFVKLC